MKKLIEIFSAEDKIKHFVIGMIIFIVALLFGVNQSLSFFIVVVAGISKEIYDYHYPDRHTVESYDVIATVVGGLVIMMFLEVIKWIF